MKRSSMLSRVFFRRPSIKDLVPDLKMVLVVLIVGCESHAGTYRPAGLAEDAGLDAAALAGALRDLETRGEIQVDKMTNEIFITSFFRDNTFTLPARKRQFYDDYMQIESPTLQEVVREAVLKNPACGLSESDFIKNQSLTFQGEGKGKGEGKPLTTTGGGVDNFLDEVAQTGNLTAAQKQILSDAAAGVVGLPVLDKRRPKNIKKWLLATAAAIKNNEFVETDSYLAARAARQAKAAVDPDQQKKDEALRERQRQESIQAMWSTKKK